MLRVVKNLEKKDLVCSCKGWDYLLPSEKAVFVDEEVFQDLQKRWPLAFSFSQRMEKGVMIPKAQRAKTPVLFTNPAPTHDMVITRFGKQTPTFGGAPDELPLEEAGSGWYGPGAEIEGATSTNV